MQGIFKRDLSRHGEATADFDEAVRLQPDNAEIYLERGRTRLELDRWEDSIEDFGEAIRLQKENIGAYYMRSLARTRLGLLDEAILDLEEAQRLARAMGSDDLAGRYERILEELREA